MNKRIKLFLILAMLLIFSGCNSTNNTKQNALYFTSKNSSIDVESLENKKIKVIDSFDNLKSTLKSIDYKIGIMIDKNVLENNNQINSLNQWLLEQKGKPIIIVGYGNPTYAYFYKLTLNKNKPKFTKEKIEAFRKEKGFSLAYICEDGKILGTGYNKLDINEILNVIKKCGKGEAYIEKMVGENE
jgi:hypothetical protein